MTANPDWSGTTGDIWAEHWRDTDRALAEVGEALDVHIRQLAPPGPFSALDVGCGPGTTSLSLAAFRSDAAIVGCDLSQSLVSIARQRAERFPSLNFCADDAEKAARERGPFDLIFSRHGVMFFDHPHRAFRTLRAATRSGGALVFSCFQAWEANSWAAELASAAAATRLSPPGREPSGFAFAEVDYVRDILQTAGWTGAEPEPLHFDYVAGEGAAAVEQAAAFLSAIGPASRAIEAMDQAMRETAFGRMRDMIVSHERDGRVIFPAAAWIWSARAE